LPPASFAILATHATNAEEREIWQVLARLGPVMGWQHCNLSGLCWANIAGP